MPDDHSEVVPLLPIPNRTVKRLCANDSADSRVKVGHRQAIKTGNASAYAGAFFFARTFQKSASSVQFEGIVQIMRCTNAICFKRNAFDTCQPVYLPARNSRLRIFPTFDFGKSSRNSMYFGRL